MEQKVRFEGDVAVLALHGRFDSYQTGQVRAWLEEATAASPARLAVNLAGVTFIDSTALATLVMGMKRARQQAGDLHLCALQQPVRMVFELTRLDKAFAIFADEQAAVQAFD
ncbi:MAG: STAS domain-containing protein [Anaerolineales bacterium]|nr:STAS domain-containing protein [Anaerolineales bacterium]MCB8983661.1 STAS domain-containing protein [Ardenticatenaceae bacterium]